MALRCATPLQLLARVRREANALHRIAVVTTIQPTQVALAANGVEAQRDCRGRCDENSSRCGTVNDIGWGKTALTSYSISSNRSSSSRSYYASRDDSDNRISDSQSVSGHHGHVASSQRYRTQR